MKFVRRTDGSGSHFVQGWVGAVVRTNCGLLVDMQTETVGFFDLKRAALEDLCSDCANEEARNAHIPGASR